MLRCLIQNYILDFHWFSFVFNPYNCDYFEMSFYSSSLDQEKGEQEVETIDGCDHLLLLVCVILVSKVQS